MLASPYQNSPRAVWSDITRDLVGQFPIPMDDLVGCVQNAWDDLYNSSIGGSALIIGTDIFFPAQATGVLLERLIAQQIHARFPDWRGGNTKIEKDIVFEKDVKFSFEIKTSSSPNGLYGNRSTGHKAVGKTKFRSGYYLVINYKLPRVEDISRKIHKIRFGWIDDDDWVGQASPTGQQASIGGELAKIKLITIS